MRSKVLALSCLAALSLFCPKTAFCDMLKTLHFNELPETAIPPDLHAFGVTFSFAEDVTIPPGTGLGADYGAPFSGVTTNLQSPVLLGNDPGVLTLTFDDPTTQLSFDAASAVTTSNVFEVRLFDVNGFSLGTSDIITNPVPCSPPSVTCPNLSQADYSYPGTGAIRTAVLDFSSLVSGATPAPFAIDNLTYLVPSVTPPGVPEPAEIGLLLAGGVLLAGRKAYRSIRR